MKIIMKKILLTLISAFMLFSCALAEEDFSGSTSSNQYIDSHATANIYESKFPFGGEVASLNTVTINFGVNFTDITPIVDIYMVHDDKTVYLEKDFVVTSDTTVKYSDSKVEGNSFSSYDGSSLNTIWYIVVENKSLAKFEVSSVKMEGTFFDK